MTNSADRIRGNEIVMCCRSPRSDLGHIGHFPTGRLESGRLQLGSPSPCSASNRSVPTSSSITSATPSPMAARSRRLPMPRSSSSARRRATPDQTRGKLCGRCCWRASMRSCPGGSRPVPGRDAHHCLRDRVPALTTILAHLGEPSAPPGACPGLRSGVAPSRGPPPWKPAAQPHWDDTPAPPPECLFDKRLSW